MRALRLKRLGAGTVTIDWASVDQLVVGTHWINGVAYLCPRPWHRSEEAALRDSSCPECVCRDPRIQTYRAAYLNGGEAAQLVEFSRDAIEAMRVKGGWMCSSRVALDRRTKQSPWRVVSVERDRNVSLEHNVGWFDLAEAVRRLWSLPRSADTLRCQDEWIEAIRTRILAEHHTRPPLPLIM